MTDEQIRLYAVARTVVPGHIRIRSIREPILDDSPFPAGTLYTLELISLEGKHRWFAVHSHALGGTYDDHLALELRAAIGG